MAPTTSIDVGVGVVTLPETGPSTETTAWMTAVGALLVAAGGAMLFARRRPA